MHNEPESNGELNASEQELADRLLGERPAPAAGFRGALGRYLASRDPGYGPRPPRLWQIVGAYLGGGALLIGLGALTGLGVL